MGTEGPRPRPWKAKLAAWWERLRTSLWLVPSIMTSGAVGLALALLSFGDRPAGEHVPLVRWFYSGSPEGARELLSAIAGSMITVAGVTFSVTVVALALASQQYGPRLLRNFMRDLGNQIVLGTFIATYLYCLLVLRSIRGPDSDGFVPHLAVTAGLVLAIASLGVLIYFIHHVTSSIQASSLVAIVGRDLEEAIDRLYPSSIGHPPKEAPFAPPKLPPDFDDRARLISASDSGYLQAVDSDCLMQISTDHDLLMKLDYRPGHFINRGNVIARVWPASRLSATLEESIVEAFVLGDERTLTQDVEFAVDQLVEVAVRALSPGINDPFTAITCLDRLGAGLSRLAERRMPSAYRHDENGRLRVVAAPVTFAGVVDAAFNAIRQYGRSSAPVTIRMLDTIRRIAEHVRTDEARAALSRQAGMIERGSQEALLDQGDHNEVRERYEAALRTLAPTDRSPSREAA